MRVEVIICPACQHRLRIPDDLMGTPVQCPDCGTEFIAPPPPPGERPALEHGADRGPAERHALAIGVSGNGDWRAAAAARIRPPAIGLVLCALGHLAWNGWNAIQATVNPDQVRKQFQQIQAVMPGPAMPMDVVQITLISGVGFALLSLIQIVGGYAMLTRRSHSLAMLAAALSLINCNTGCCLAGIPVGVWALIVLFLPDVKASFR